MYSRRVPVGVGDERRFSVAFRRGHRYEAPTIGDTADDLSRARSLARCGVCAAHKRGPDRVHQRRLLEALDRGARFGVVEDDRGRPCPRAQRLTILSWSRDRTRYGGGAVDPVTRPVDARVADEGSPNSRLRAGSTRRPGEPRSFEDFGMRYASSGFRERACDDGDPDKTRRRLAIVKTWGNVPRTSPHKKRCSWTPDDTGAGCRRASPPREPARASANVLSIITTQAEAQIREGDRRPFFSDDRGISGRSAAYASRETAAPPRCALPGESLGQSPSSNAARAAVTRDPHLPCARAHDRRSDRWRRDHVASPHQSRIHTFAADVRALMHPPSHSRSRCCDVVEHD